MHTLTIFHNDHQLLPSVEIVVELDDVGVNQLSMNINLFTSMSDLVLRHTC